MQLGVVSKQSLNQTQPSALHRQFSTQSAQALPPETHLITTTAFRRLGLFSRQMVRSSTCRRAFPRALLRRQCLISHRRSPFLRQATHQAMLQHLLLHSCLQLLHLLYQLTHQPLHPRQYLRSCRHLLRLTCRPVAHPRTNTQHNDLIFRHLRRPLPLQQFMFHLCSQFTRQRWPLWEYRLPPLTMPCLVLGRSLV